MLAVKITLSHYQSNKRPTKLPHFRGISSDDQGGGAVLPDGQRQPGQR